MHGASTDDDALNQSQNSASSNSLFTASERKPKEDKKAYWNINVWFQEQKDMISKSALQTEFS